MGMILFFIFPQFETYCNKASLKSSPIKCEEVLYINEYSDLYSPGFKKLVLKSNLENSSEESPSHKMAAWSKSALPKVLGELQTLAEKRVTGSTHLQSPARLYATP